MPTAVSRRAKPAKVSAPHAASTLEVLPRTGVVIAAEAHNLREVAAMLRALTPAPVIAGWIDLGPGGAAADELDTDPPRLGDLSDLPLLAARLGLRCAVACVRAADTARAARVRAAAAGTALDLRFLPPLSELLAPPPATAAAAAPTEASTAVPGRTYQAAPTIDLAALIGRQPYQIDREAVGRAITGKRVLITGAGGSIGSELARVAAGFAPESIILMERSENALFEIDRQLARRFPAVGRRAILHDVVDEEGTLRLLDDARPHVVLHAAAHKHVPLMEDHPGHAITNNLFGTRSIADAAVACGAERFVLISSDKAVNPTSVMGATKRMAEMYVRGLGNTAAAAQTRLSMVRFGNVLGSACSVLTIWSTQVSEVQGGMGGPLTITDPRMTRYFMTIPEAATLVVQSMVVEDAGPADSGRVGVYVLDMGEPIRILELAARFIRAHGLTPRVDARSAQRVIGEAEAAQIAAGFAPSDGAACPPMDVVFTGSRPGEKLHEELAYAAEMLAPTSHPGVRVWAGPGFGEHDAARVQAMVADMAAARYGRDRDAIIDAIRRHVPEMRRE